MWILLQPWRSRSLSALKLLAYTATAKNPRQGPRVCCIQWPTRLLSLDFLNIFCHVFFDISNKTTIWFSKSWTLKGFSSGHACSKDKFERSRGQMNCKHVDWISHKYPAFWKVRQKQLGEGWGSWILRNWKWCWEENLSLPGRPGPFVNCLKKRRQHFHLLFLALMCTSGKTLRSLYPTHRCLGMSDVTGASLGAPRDWRSSGLWDCPLGALSTCQSLKVPVSMKISRCHIPDGGKIWNITWRAWRCRKRPKQQHFQELYLPRRFLS